ncbi:MAG: DASS family sodium-coupled anion symporter [Deltaproteobacteria bacterium]|nr:DASS family sodium-coupled anion symporter [Deltaproteobacteria bacterium]
MEPAEDKDLRIGEHGSFSGLKDNRGMKSVLGIFFAVLGAILVYYVLSAITVEHGSAADIRVLSKAGRGLAAIFVAALILWSTEAIPIGMTSLLMIVLPPILKVVTSISDAAVGFTTPVVYFVIGAYCIAFAVVQSGTGQRFALWLFTCLGTNSRGAVLSSMVGTAAISALVSDVPACAIFMALTLPILTKIDAKPGSSNLGKAMMMGIPIAALIGGVATPLGSSINILGINLLQKTASIDVTFLQWMAIGVPMVVVLIPFAWWVLTRIYPPEVESIGDINEFKEELKSMGPLKTKEKKVVAILAIIFVLCILGTWVKPLNTATVLIGGAILIFLPGINLATWRNIESFIGWEAVLMIGAVTSLGLMATDTGLSTWLVKNTLGGITGWNIVLLVASISAFTVILHLPLPIAPTINAVLIPAMVVLAKDAGINPAIFALPVAFTASCAFLLPLDAVPLVTYSKGYYRMFDMLIPGILISAVWVIIMTALMLTIGPIIGFR